MEVPEFELAVDRIAAPGGFQYVVHDNEGPERGVLFGPVKDRNHAMVFIIGYNEAIEWAEKVGECDDGI